MDYKEKLRQKAAAAPDRQAGEDGAPAGEMGFADSVRDLAREEGAGRVVFQSVAVTALQLIERAHRRNDEAGAAAISLGQRQKLQSMKETLSNTADALQQALSKQGRQMLDLSNESAGPEDRETPEQASWWFALTEAIEALEAGSQQMSSLASGQPEDSSARKLGELIAHLLDRQHTELLIEADQWIS